MHCGQRRNGLNDRRCLSTRWGNVWGAQILAHGVSNCPAATLLCFRGPKCVFRAKMLLQGPTFFAVWGQNVFSEPKFCSRGQRYFAVRGQNVFSDPKVYSMLSLALLSGAKLCFRAEKFTVGPNLASRPNCVSTAKILLQAQNFKIVLHDHISPDFRP